MKLDTLYKRTKTGAIQFWSIETSATEIIKTSGKLGTTNPLIHRELVTAGKQSRTPVEQAEFQAQSDWKKKKDEGYKSLSDLGISQHDGYVGQDLSLPEMLNVRLTEFNTDASGNIKPMLAKEVNYKKLSFPCYIQPKLDGVRCLMIWNGDSVQFLSRNGKLYTTLEHIASKLPALNPKVGPIVLDGEIYSDELTFQEITSAVKALKESSMKLKYRVYDVVSMDVQSERLLFLEGMVRYIDLELVQLVSTSIVNSRDEVKKLHDDFVQQGFEGAILRPLVGHYEQGQRSSNLLKVKEFDSTEFIFRKFEWGQRDEDLIAVCTLPDGRVFKAKMTGTKLQKQKLVTEKPSGKLIVKHFGYTDDGMPRFPVGIAFRDYE